MMRAMAEPLSSAAPTSTSTSVVPVLDKKPFHHFQFTIRSHGNTRGLVCYSSSVRSNNNNNSHTRRGDAAGGGREQEEEWVSSPGSASPYQILGVDPTCSPSHLKAAFRSRVKQFHPDVCKDIINAEEIIQHVIRAYEILSKQYKAGDTSGAFLDPFEEPEDEACDLFINEVLCIGKGCPYSCVQRAPYAFVFSAENGTACAATCQGYGDDYLVQLAVGQCPRTCIHYVTPSQRALLEDVLHNVLNNPYDMGEAALLEHLIMKATVENKRWSSKKIPKRQPKASTEHVDWC